MSPRLRAAGAREKSAYALGTHSSRRNPGKRREIDRLSTIREHPWPVNSDFLTRAAASGCPVVEVRATAALDALGTAIAPAAIRFDVASGKILALGEQAGDLPAISDAAVLNLESAVLIPGLVNAHAHLDLTLIGPVPHASDAGFVSWIENVRTGRPSTEAEIERAVQAGIVMTLRGGTVAIGDIAGAAGGIPQRAPWRTLDASTLWGVSYIEAFAMGARESAALERLETFFDALLSAGSISKTMRIGLSPHAPYSVSRNAYRCMLKLAKTNGLPVCTHLGESPEERALVAHGSGPLRTFLERLGIWKSDLASLFGLGLSPVEHLAEFLDSNVAAIHVNDCPDASFALLASSGASVVYCPRASAYFAAEASFGPHRYQEMLAQGIPVALGTDSVLNLPPETRGCDLEFGCDLHGRLPQGGRISVLDEMRVLSQRDGADPDLLLAMGTIHGAKVLGIPQDRFGLRVGDRPIGLVSIPIPELREPSKSDAAECWKIVLKSDSAPRLLWMWK
ncbi:MAG: amidohydrolase family protein [Phycisphaeraceae bacterium]|nr:amidohydrolase family protein [Phycisphaeraceae bacterium]